VLNSFPFAQGVFPQLFNHEQRHLSIHLGQQAPHYCLPPYVPRFRSDLYMGCGQLDSGGACPPATTPVGWKLLLE